MAENEAAEAAPKKKSKMLLVIIAVVALGATGAGAFLMLRGGGSSTEATAKPEPGEIVKLDAVTINLADGHYLKLKLALQASADVKEGPDGSKAQGIAGDQLTGADMATLQTAKGRRLAQARLTHAIVKAYTEEEKETVIDVYYPEFVSQ
jgi:flagellar protein FliL